MSAITDIPQSRAAWLEARKEGLGATDSPAILGLTPQWSSPLQVYLEKCGYTVPDQVGEHLDWGRQLEALVAEEAGRRLGETLAHSGKIYKHQGFDWLICTPDYLDDKGRPFEIKTSRVSEGWGPAGTDRVPINYLVQVYHQCIVLGQTEGRLACLIGGQELRLYQIHLSWPLRDKLITVLKDFWTGHILARKPPEPDWTHERTPELLALLNPVDDTLECTLTEDIEELALQYKNLGETASQIKKERDRLKGQLIHALGQARVGHLPSGLQVVRRDDSWTEDAKPARDKRRTVVTVKEPNTDE